MHYLVIFEFAFEISRLNIGVGDAPHMLAGMCALRFVSGGTHSGHEAEDFFSSSDCSGLLICSINDTTAFVCRVTTQQICVAVALAHEYPQRLDNFESAPLDGVPGAARTPPEDPCSASRSRTPMTKKHKSQDFPV